MGFPVTFRHCLTARGLRSPEQVSATRVAGLRIGQCADARIIQEKYVSLIALAAPLACMAAEVLPLMQLNRGRAETVPSDGRVSKSGLFFAITRAFAAAWNAGTGCTNEPGPRSVRVTEAQGLRCPAACAGKNCCNRDDDNSSGLR